MMKLARLTCFGLVATMSVAALSMTGCSSPPPPAVQAPGNTQSATPAVAQPESQTAPANRAEPVGEISLARNFYFVFDGSGSMGGSKLRDAKQAVKEFLTTVPDDVNLGLYVFDYYGDREVLPLAANNRKRFVEEIDKVYDGGGTPLGAAVARGVKTLAAQREKQLQYGEYRLIVITDGDASDYIETGTDSAAQHLIPIYTIGFHIGERHALRKHSVWYKSANDLHELRKALSEAAAELDVFDPQSFQQQPKK